MFHIKRPDDSTMKLIKLAGDRNRSVALKAQRELAAAFEVPLRDAILSGDLLSGLFQPIQVESDNALRYPLDLLAPGEEDEHVAYTKPSNGRIPERQVEGDYVMIPTYEIANAIDVLLTYMREANYDVVGRALQVLRYGFVQKLNDDGWHVVVNSVADRNILIYDADAAAGQFTRRLISLVRLAMQRNGGGNSSSINRFTLTDLWTSVEAHEDMRNWGLDQVDDVTRRELYLASDDSPVLSKIAGTVIHPIHELGVDQKYQLFFTSTLAASLASGDKELVIGTDLNKGSFIMPVKDPVKIYEDPWFHRAGKASWYGTTEVGFALLDNRSAIAASL